MAVPSQALPTLGQPNSSEDPKIRSCLSELQTVLTSGVDETNIANALLIKLGLNNASQIGRAAFAQAAAGTTTSTTFADLSNGPDQVTGIVVPSNGRVFMWYSAIWQDTVASNNGVAAIFFGANQLVQMNGAGAPTAQSAFTSGSANDDDWVMCGMTGLFSLGGGGNATYPGAGVPMASSSTGGGIGCFRVDAGTYTISVKFKNTAAGTLTAKNREMLVWVVGP